MFKIFFFYYWVTNYLKLHGLKNIFLLSHSFCWWEVQTSSAGSLFSYIQGQNQNVESRCWVLVWRLWGRILFQYYLGCWLNSVSRHFRIEVLVPCLAVSQYLLLVSKCHWHFFLYAPSILKTAVACYMFLVLQISLTSSSANSEKTFCFPRVMWLN